MTAMALTRPPQIGGTMNTAEKARHWLETGNIDCYYSKENCSNTAQIIRDLLAEYQEIVQLAVDAGIITRSCCHELIGMSHQEIARLFVNSPIGKETAKRCVEIATAQIPTSPGTWDKGAAFNAEKIARLIKEEYGLSE